MFSVLLQKDLLKKVKKFEGRFFQTIIFTFVTEGLPSSFLSRPVAQVQAVTQYWAARPAR